MVNPWVKVIGSEPFLVSRKKVSVSVSAYPDPKKVEKGLMDAKYDGTELADAADMLVQQFQKDASREAGIFHHLITLPTYHETALGTDVLAGSNLTDTEKF